MDPVAAFSIACGVIQLVDFGTKVALGCREIYESGSLRGNDHVEEVATTLKHVSEDLERHLAHGTVGDRELSDLAGKSAKTANNLLLFVDSLTMKARKSKRGALGKTLKTMWKKSEIDELKKQLDSYQRILETGMLRRLITRFDLATLEQQNAFAALDQGMQSMIQKMTEGHVKLADIVRSDGKATRVLVVQDGEITRKEIRDDGETSRGHVTKKFDELKVSQVEEQHYRALLNSLFFADIFARQESIKDSHKTTFQWIFDRNERKGQRPWSNFVDWLEHGHGIYWISGKAGSGKSTLMNFVTDDQRTNEALMLWAGRMEFFTPTFFFWNAGSELQKSITGLLRSIIYQILKRRPALVSMIVEDQISAWTEKKLLRVLRQMLDATTLDCKLCVFIDGLDEFDGDHQDLTVILGTIKQSSNVKVCVSSRHLRAFQASFKSSPQLKLEDLTREDIINYVNDKLQKTQAAKLTDELAWKADGVFLWVFLAVKDLLRGVFNDDTETELWHRLRSLPKEIGDLYQHILQQIDTEYQATARLIFRLVLVHQDKARKAWTVQNLSLLALALAEYGRIDAILESSFQESDLQKLVSVCSRMRSRIVVLCAGLLEVDDPPLEEIEKVKSLGHEMSAAYEELMPFDKQKLRFLHRSAYDFLREDEKGIAFLATSPTLDADAATMLFKAGLGMSKLRPHQKAVGRYFREISYMVALAEFVYSMTGDPQEILLGILDKVFTDIHLASQKSSAMDVRHWSSDFGIWRIRMLLEAKGPADIVLAPFVGFMGFEGVFAYALEHIDRLPQAHLAEATSRLLLIILGAPSNSFANILTIAKELLRRGADFGMAFQIPPELHANHRFCDGPVTSWKFFLDRIAEYVFQDRKHEEDTSNEAICLAKLFLDQNIDPSINAEILVLLALDSMNSPENESDTDVAAGADANPNDRADADAVDETDVENEDGSDADTEQGIKLHLYIRFKSCIFFRGFDTNRYGLVMSISPALVLGNLSGSLVDLLPPGMRAAKSQVVTHVRKRGSKTLHDISETQAAYLTDVCSTSVSFGNSSPALWVLQDRLIEVLDEIAPDSASEEDSETDFLWDSEEGEEYSTGRRMRQGRGKGQLIRAAVKSRRERHRGSQDVSNV